MCYTSTYHKLVRDRILAIIEADGLDCNICILLQEKYLLEIKKKLYEEIKDFEGGANEKDAIEEMMDILELLHVALDIYSKSFADLEAVRTQKKKRRGGFSKGLYLIDVEDK